MTVSTPLEERFWKYVDKKSDDECWEWKAYIHPSGYGTIARGKLLPVRMLQAHRVSWELHFGDIPKGMLVCHTCDNRICVNPKHLFLGTHKDNAVDMVNKNRGFVPDNSGENHGRSKLSKLDVLSIRSIWRTNIPRPTQRQLAKRYNVSVGTIRDIISYRSWKCLP